jgi:hypothetical protein
MAKDVAFKNRHYFFDGVYKICTNVVSIECSVAHKLYSCLSTKMYCILTKITRQNVTMIFVSGKMYITIRTLQETLLTKHVISGEDRMELTETMYDVKQRNQRLFTHMWFKIKTTEINFFICFLIKI